MDEHIDTDLLGQISVHKTLLAGEVSILVVSQLKVENELKKDKLLEPTQN